MRVVQYTLLGDGPSDACLKHAIEWALRRCLAAPAPGLVGSFIWREAPDARGTERLTPLERKVAYALNQAPCDLLFVHRDAESSGSDARLEEIERATEGCSSLTVPVVPVRMTEAWLLCREAAIRQAADNPHGTTRLPIPLVKHLEREKDPKDALRNCLDVASEKRGRHLDRFRRDHGIRAQRVAELIDDFSPLLVLPAFSRFVSDTRRAAKGLGLPLDPP